MLTGYTYDFAGNLTSITYPSGRVIQTDYDTAGRAYKASNATSSSLIPYGEVATFSPHGAIASLKLGWNTSSNVEVMTENWLYNNRLQPQQTSLNLPGTTVNIRKLEYFYCANQAVTCNSSGTGVGSIDNEINSKQCGKAGGYWVDGTITQARFAHGSLILTGPTNGENRTSASYALGPDPGLMALQEAGNRAGRDLTTFLIAEGVFATAYVSTYAGPALYTALMAGGKGFQLARNASGKIKGNIEDIRAAVYRMSPEQLKQAADELRRSIQVRTQELLKLREEPAHRLRIAQERDLLRTIEKKLGGN